MTRTLSPYIRERLREMAAKWREGSTCTYDSLDSVEACAAELEAFITGCDVAEKFVGKTCIHCGSPSEGNYSIMMWVKQEADFDAWLCDACGSGVTPTLAQIQVAFENRYLSRDDGSGVPATNRMLGRGIPNTVREAHAEAIRKRGGK